MNTKIYEVVKNETGVKGYWKDNHGKVFIDNIFINEKPLQSGAWHKVLNDLFASGELAVFYIIDGTAYIESKEGQITALNRCSTFYLNELTNDNIEHLLKEHGGFTAHFQGSKILIEIWSTERGI